MGTTAGAAAQGLIGSVVGVYILEANNNGPAADAVLTGRQAGRQADCKANVRIVRPRG
jgi:hypothetical protein